VPPSLTYTCPCSINDDVQCPSTSLKSSSAISAKSHPAVAMRRYADCPPGRNRSTCFAAVFDRSSHSDTHQPANTLQATNILQSLRFPTNKLLDELWSTWGRLITWLHSPRSLATVTCQLISKDVWPCQRLGADRHAVTGHCDLTGHYEQISRPTYLPLSCKPGSWTVIDRLAWVITDRLDIALN
jgi:hypothetical protein